MKSQTQKDAEPLILKDLNLELWLFILQYHELKRNGEKENEGKYYHSIGKRK